jgi:cytosine/uracil/thiamine/allantoin permease
MICQWNRICIVGTIFVILLTAAAPVWATQTHGEPEGLVVHQLTHLFFIFSMGLLIYWLRQRKLVKLKAWRYIQYSAMLFILWNIDTFGVHLLDEQVDLIRIRRLDTWHLQIDTAARYRLLVFIYYIAKLDHLLCVPALLCLYMGLKRLYHENHSTVKKVSP